MAKLSGKQWADAAGVHGHAERLRLRAQELIEEDSTAYLAFVAAVRSGKDVAGAQARTVEIPLEIVRAAAEISTLAVQSASMGNPRLRADAVVAAMLSAAAAESGAFLVAVNVGDGEDERLDEARRLASETSARLQSPAVRGSEGGRDRGPALS